MTLQQKIAVWVIVQAVKHHKWEWLALKLVRYFSLHLRIDRENKTWTLTSKPMWAPAYQVRNYEDLAAIFKSDPRSFQVTEEHDEAGRLKRFTVTT